MAKFDPNTHLYTKEPPPDGSVRWMIAPQVGHSVHAEDGFDFIGKVEVFRAPSVPRGIQIKPIKILLNTIYTGEGGGPHLKEGELLDAIFTADFLFTESEVYHLTNKDLVMRLIFEGTSLLEKIGAIAPTPKPQPPLAAGSWDPVTIEVKNLDDNQDDSIVDIFEECAQGKESLFALWNNSIVNSVTVVDLKTHHYSVVVRAKKNKATLVRTVMKQRLPKALASFAISKWKKSGGKVINVN